MSAELSSSEAVFRELSNLMRVQRDNGSGFCLFLGTGCSLSSSDENISTAGILTRYLQDRRPETNWPELSHDEVYRAFVNSWLLLGAKDRNDVLSKYLPADMQPSPGYINLARLVGAGCVKAVITTNFNNLIDRAFSLYGIDYEFYCGTNAPSKPSGRPAVVKLVKVHGGLHQCDLAFGPADLDQLPKGLRSLVRELSQLPMLVVGYSGQDRGVMKALSPSSDRTAFWASPRAPSRSDPASTDRIFDWLGRRVPKGDPLLTGDDYGRFDALMTRLHDELLAGGAPPVGTSHFR